MTRALLIFAVDAWLGGGGGADIVAISLQETWGSTARAEAPPVASPLSPRSAAIRDEMETRVMSEIHAMRAEAVAEIRAETVTVPAAAPATSAIDKIGTAETEEDDGDASWPPPAAEKALAMEWLADIDADAAAPAAAAAQITSVQQQQSTPPADHQAARRTLLDTPGFGDLGEVMRMDDAPTAAGIDTGMVEALGGVRQLRHRF